ncbi:MAG: hypothetical protein ACFFD4_04505 [Candidatus Odinarchaeota archaeon]
MEMQTSHWSKGVLTWILTWPGKAGKKLIEPSPELLDPRDRRHARLLSILLFILTVFSAVLLVYEILVFLNQLPALLTDFFLF